jgi:PAS domain S-box-containing protein
MSRINIDIYFDESPDPMLVCRTDTLQIVEGNEAAVSLFGVSKNDLQNRTLKELFPNEVTWELDEIQGSDPQVFKNLGPWEQPINGGKNPHLSAKACPVTTGGNTCKLILISDVTKEKLLESQLEVNDQILSIIKQKLPGTFFVFDMDGRMRRWNNYAQQITGYSKEEIGNMNALDFFEDEEKEKISKAIRTAIKEGYVEVRGNLVGKYGDKVPLLFKGSKATIDGSERIIGLGVDISNVIAAQKEAQTHQKLLQAIIDQSESIIYIKDEESSLKFANKKYYNLFGLADKQELANRNKSLLDDEQAQKIQKNDEYVRETGKTVRFEEEINIDGERKTFLSTKMLLKGVEQYENCIFGISTDITDRKKTEKQLEESVKEKEILLSEIHHRVKNNLAIISGLMDLEIMESSDDDLIGKLKDSQSRINSIATTHEILYQERNFSDLDFEKTIKRLVERILEMFNSDVVIDYDIETIDININQALPCALIVNELITNALKHAFEAGDDNMITVKARQPDEKVWVQISDNGKGLPDDIDLEKSMTLGMQLINTLIDQLNGDGKFTQDNGTTFELAFEKQNAKGVGSSFFDAHLTDEK